MHTAHAVVFGILSLSGILLLPAPFSDWRESLLGGYGQTVRDVHLWLVIPYTLLLVSTATTYALGALRRPSRSFKYVYKKLNATISIPAALALLITGVILWARESLPFALTQAAREVHTVLTWVAVPWVALHGVVEATRWLMKSSLPPRMKLRAAPQGRIRSSRRRSAGGSSPVHPGFPPPLAGRE